MKRRDDEHEEKEIERERESEWGKIVFWL